MAKSESDDLVLLENTNLLVLKRDDTIDPKTRRIIKFIRGMLVCRLFNEKGEKTSKNDTYIRIYKITHQIRSSLGISGGAGDPIPRVYMEKYPYIPKYLFETETKNDRIKSINGALIKLKNVTNLLELSQL